jgi:hypothetical protein
LKTLTVVLAHIRDLPPAIRSAGLWDDYTSKFSLSSRIRYGHEGHKYFAKRELTALFVFDIDGTYLGDIISICDRERSS